MLAGKAAIGIWNGIAPEGRAEFYAWHVREHIPERIGIPGFCRGRRYVAVDAQTHPAYFTLYEVETFEVLQGPDYAARLNAPTAWTRVATGYFRDTARALAHVLDSGGPGMGGCLLTVRFDADPNSAAQLMALTRATLEQPRVCGAHLCRADLEKSDVRTAESKDRTDIEAPPAWFILVEATDPEALAGLLPIEVLVEAGGTGPFHRGVYQLEFVRDRDIHPSHH